MLNQARHRERVQADPVLVSPPLSRYSNDHLVLLAGSECAWIIVAALVVRLAVESAGCG
jgi:hypothetical protein